MPRADRTHRATGLPDTREPWRNGRDATAPRFGCGDVRHATQPAHHLRSGVLRRSGVGGIWGSRPSRSETRSGSSSRESWPCSPMRRVSFASTRAKRAAPWPSHWKPQLRSTHWGSVAARGAVHHSLRLDRPAMPSRMAVQAIQPDLPCGADLRPTLGGAPPRGRLRHCRKRRAGLGVPHPGMGNRGPGRTTPRLAENRPHR